MQVMNHFALLRLVCCNIGPKRLGFDAKISHRGLEPTLYYPRVMIIIPTPQIGVHAGRTECAGLCQNPGQIYPANESSSIGESGGEIGGCFLGLSLIEQ